MKKILAILLIFVLTFSLVACGNKDDKNQAMQDGQEEQDEQGTDEGKTGLSGTIEIWSWDVAAKSLEEAAAEFKKIHPDVDFQIEDLGTDQVYDKLTTRLASNTGLPDVVSIEAERVTTFASKFPKGFVDLTEVVNTDDFLPVKVSECRVGDKIVAFPWDAAPSAIFYRVDYFEQAGIDPESIETWDDFIEAGKKINDLGVKMIPIAPSKNITVYGMLLNQLGSYYFDNEGNTAVNSPESIKAMEYVKKMYDADITFDNTNWDGLVTATKEGKIATVPSAVWWAGTLQDECEETSGKWRVMKLPVVEKGLDFGAVYGGSNIMIPEGAENKEAAIEFVKFAMTDIDAQINGFSKYGLYPSYIPSYNEPVFDEEVEYFGGQKIWKFFTEIGKDIPELNYTENSDEAYNHIRDAQARILLKGADVEKTMNELQENLVNIFGQ